MRSLAHTVPSRLVIPFGVWFSFNFGNTLFNLLFRFGSDSHSRCHSSCSKSLILFPKSEATIVFEASFSDRASFAASSASSLPFMPIWLGIQQKTAKGYWVANAMGGGGGGEGGRERCITSWIRGRRMCRQGQVGATM